MLCCLLLSRRSKRASHLQNLRHAEILACNSVAEIIELIPDDYRMFIADHFGATTVQWGHFLPPFGARPRNVNFRRTMRKRMRRKPINVQSDDRFAATRTAQLDSDIAARTLEETFLLEAIKPEKAFLDMRAAVAPQAAAIHGALQGAAIAIRDTVWADCGVYAHRAIAIAFNAGKREQIKIEKKKDLADKAQVAASDGDTLMGDATLATAIQREVKRQVMGHNMPRDKKTKVTQSRGGGGPSNLTRKAREAAATVQSRVQEKGPGGRYGTRLAGFLSRSESAALKSFTHRKNRARPNPQQKERYTVVAKAEGSQKKRGKRGKGGGKGKQQQQQQASTSTAKPDRKGKGRAT
ncbi:hypothetical protein EDB84DRAFT_1571367 [Lactarius hengduanensis]|nr:hypothetical protein EDB84DRAFT_1571367 [Lactarius hengduanensis]